MHNMLMIISMTFTLSLTLKTFVRLIPLVFVCSPSSFQINSLTGQISSRRSFDFEVQRVYTFTVLATDGAGGSDARTGLATVTVNIRDLADNVPLFDVTSYTFYVDEGTINANVGTVVVS